MSIELFPEAQLNHKSIILHLMIMIWVIADYMWTSCLSLFFCLGNWTLSRDFDSTLMMKSFAIIVAIFNTAPVKRSIIGIGLSSSLDFLSFSQKSIEIDLRSYQTFSIHKKITKKVLLSTMKVFLITMQTLESLLSLCMFPVFLKKSLVTSKI